MTKRIAALFDIDGTLIITGGAAAAAWRLAFQELYGIPADIGEFTDTGMTDPDVGHKTFAAVLGHEPSQPRARARTPGRRGPRSEGCNLAAQWAAWRSSARASASRISRSSPARCLASAR